MMHQNSQQQSTAAGQFSTQERTYYSALFLSKAGSRPCIDMREAGEVLKTFKMNSTALNVAATRIFAGAKVTQLDVNSFLLFCKFLSIYKKTGKEPTQYELSRPYDIIFSTDEQLHKQATDAVNQSTRPATPQNPDTLMKKNRGPMQIDSTQDYRAPTRSSDETYNQGRQQPSQDLDEDSPMTIEDYQQVQKILKSATPESDGSYSKKNLKTFIASFKNCNLKKAVEYYKLVEPTAEMLTYKQIVIFCWYLFKNDEYVAVPLTLPQGFQSFISGRSQLPVGTPAEPVEQLFRRQPEAAKQAQVFQSVPQDIDPLMDDRMNPRFDVASPGNSQSQQGDPAGDSVLEQLIESLEASLSKKKEQQKKLVESLEASQAEQRRVVDAIKQAAVQVNNALSLLSTLNATLESLKKTTAGSRTAIHNSKNSVEEASNNSHTLIQQIKDCSSLISQQSDKIKTLEQAPQHHEKDQHSDEEQPEDQYSRTEVSGAIQEKNNPLIYSNVEAAGFFSNDPHNLARNNMYSPDRGQQLSHRATDEQEGLFGDQPDSHLDTETRDGYYQQSLPHNPLMADDEREDNLGPGGRYHNADFDSSQPYGVTTGRNSSKLSFKPANQNPLFDDGELEASMGPADFFDDSVPSNHTGLFSETQPIKKSQKSHYDKADLEQDEEFN